MLMPLQMRRASSSLSQLWLLTAPTNAPRRRPVPHRHTDLERMGGRTEPLKLFWTPLLSGLLLLAVALLITIPQPIHGRGALTFCSWANTMNDTNQGEHSRLHGCEERASQCPCGVTSPAMAPGEEVRSEKEEIGRGGLVRSGEGSWCGVFGGRAAFGAEGRLAGWV